MELQYPLLAHLPPSPVVLVQSAPLHGTLRAELLKFH